jgi:MarR family transcriptional regulator, organic hydroperoxide resistance regulator
MSHYLQDYIGYKLVQIVKQLRHRAEEALNTLHLHPGQEMLLFQLWNEEGLTQSQLVENLRVEPPTITKALQRMEHAGFIARTQDVEDARVFRVYLTPKGREIQAEVQNIWDALEAQTVKGLSEVEKALLGRLLDQIDQNFSA